MVSTRWIRILALGVAVPALALAQAPQPQASLDPPEGFSAVVMGAADCAGGEIYDDGTAENGYSGNPAVVTTFEMAQVFTPPSYPWTYPTVCVALTSLASPSPSFEIVLWDDDGAGGSPGTVLGAVPATAPTVPVYPAFGFYSFDLSPLGLVIDSGNVWIGVRWNPAPGQYLSADESASTPLHPGYVNFNVGDGWETIGTYWPAERAMFIRALGEAPVAPPSILDIPTLGVAGLGALLVVLAGAAVVMLRRRRA